MSTGPSAIKRRRNPPTGDQPSSRDASEEDNDDSTGAPNVARTHPTTAVAHSPARPKKTELSSFHLSDDADLSSESPTYDGDIESSTSAFRPSTDLPSSSASSVFPPTTDLPARGTTPTPSTGLTSSTPQPPSSSAASAVKPEHNGPPIVQLSEDDIRAFVQRAIDGVPEKGVETRNFKVNKPPTDRPVRIYADGVYDLFHFGHALQLRQAKLCFPSVHLIIGVCSDTLCSSHKAPPALTHAERCESVSHCRWVDQVVPEAPWELDQAFVDKYEIDYVAHDEEPYKAEGMEDVYEFVKKQGKFLPTRRTPGISTSDLLERVVKQYRSSAFDGKFVKNGHPELSANLVDWSSRVASAVGSEAGDA